MEIGRGGFGKILVLDNDPSLVQKVNTSDVFCKDLKNEYELQLSAHEALVELRKKVLMSSFVEIPHPFDWKPFNGGKKCSYLMERIFPPIVGEKYLWHVYWSHEDPHYDKTIAEAGSYIRGRYLGREKLLSLLPQLSIPVLLRSMGLLIATVQFGSMQTGVDVELVLGRRGDPEGPLMLWLIDFDKSQETKYLKENDKIEQWMWTLDAEPYWPISTDPGYEYFRESYLDTIEFFEPDLVSIGENILDNRLD